MKNFKLFYSFVKVILLILIICSSTTLHAGDGGYGFSHRDYINYAWSGWFSLIYNINGSKIATAEIAQWEHFKKFALGCGDRPGFEKACGWYTFNDQQNSALLALSSNPNDEGSFQSIEKELYSVRKQSDCKDCHRIMPRHILIPNTKTIAINSIEYKLTTTSPDFNDYPNYFKDPFNTVYSKTTWEEDTSKDKISICFPEYEVDSNGNRICEVDVNGNPIHEVDKDGNKIPYSTCKYKIKKDSNGKEISNCGVPQSEMKEVTTKIQDFDMCRVKDGAGYHDFGRYAVKFDDVPWIIGCDIKNLTDTSTYESKFSHNDFADSKEANENLYKLRIKLAEAWRQSRLKWTGTTYTDDIISHSENPYKSYCYSGDKGILTLLSTDPNATAPTYRIKSNAGFRHTLIRLNINKDEDGFEPDAKSVTLNQDINNVDDKHYYSGLIGKGKIFRTIDTTILSRGARVLIERSKNDWFSKTEILSTRIAAAGNKIGIFIDDSEEQIPNDPCNASMFDNGCAPDEIAVQKPTNNPCSPGENNEKCLNGMPKLTGDLSLDQSAKFECIKRSDLEKENHDGRSRDFTVMNVLGNTYYYDIYDAALSYSSHRIDKLFVKPISEINDIPFIVSPVLIGKGTPDYDYYIPIRKEVCKNGESECLSEEKEVKIDALVINPNIKATIKLTYPTCADDNCERLNEATYDDSGKEITSEYRNNYIKIQTLKPPSSATTEEKKNEYIEKFNIKSLAGFSVSENVDTNSTNSVLISEKGTRILPISTLEGEERNINCYLAKNALSNIASEKYSKLYTVCDIGTNKEFSAVITNSLTNNDNLIYEVVYLPTYGNKVDNFIPVRFDFHGIPQNIPDNENKIIGNDAFNYYGIVVGDNGMESYHYKLNFIISENLEDRSFDIYADKTVNKLNGFSSDKTYIFFENNMAGSVTSSNFEDNTSNDIYKDNKFQSTWLEMKRMYDQFGREIKFRIARDMSTPNGKDVLITIGFIKDSIIELIDPLFSHGDGTEEPMCEGEIFCTLQDFVKEEDLNLKKLEPLSKIQCNQEESINYLCLGSSPNTWDFNSYKDLCAKTTDFKNNIVNKLNGENIFFEGNTEILNIPLSSEEKPSHLYHWCMPLYTKDNNTSSMVERFVCEIDKKVIIDDNNFTCKTCIDNTIPNSNKTSCEPCPEAKIADNGECKDPEDIPPETIVGECPGTGPFVVANTCSCPTTSQKVFNPDATQFKCVTCETGKDLDPNNWGGCINLTDAELAKKKADCELAGMNWDEANKKCELLRKAKVPIACPIAGEFSITERYAECACPDGNKPVINSETNMGVCGKVDPGLAGKAEGGCNLSNSNSTSMLSILFLLLLFGIRKRKLNCTI